MEVTSKIIAKLSNFIFIFFIILSCTACRLTEERGFMPRAAYMPDNVTNEIQYLSNNGIISSETNLWINSMIINNCMMIEYYQGMECGYPEFKHKPNVRDAR